MSNENTIKCLRVSAETHKKLLTIKLATGKFIDEIISDLLKLYEEKKK